MRGFDSYQIPQYDKYSTMRIFEILSESLTEAISVAKYEDPVNDAIKEAIQDSFGELLKLKGHHPDEEREFDDDDGNQKSFMLLMKNKFRLALKWRVADKIHKTLNREIGSPVVSYVSVIELPENVGGQANGTSIELNSILTDHLTKNIMDRAFDSTISSYGPGEYVSGFYYLCRMIAGGDRYLSGVIIDDKSIKKISSVVIHELVHVLQHAAQYDKGRGETEYRSYLDKRKGEFLDLHHKKYAQEKNSDEEDTDLQDKYNRYYRASPQEIAAFAHQAALKVIDDYGFNEATTLEELQDIDTDSIIHSVDWITGRLFAKPRTPREAMVRKRYMKLVYLEVKRYIEHRRQVLAGKA